MGPACANLRVRPHGATGAPVETTIVLLSPDLLEAPEFDEASGLIVDLRSGSRAREDQRLVGVRVREGTLGEVLSLISDVDLVPYGEDADAAQRKLLGSFTFSNRLVPHIENAPEAPGSPGASRGSGRPARPRRTSSDGTACCATSGKACGRTAPPGVPRCSPLDGDREEQPRGTVRLAVRLRLRRDLVDPRRRRAPGADQAGGTAPAGAHGCLHRRPRRGGAGPGGTARARHPGTARARHPENCARPAPGNCARPAPGNCARPAPGTGGC